MPEWITAVASLVTAAAVILGVISLSVARQQTHRELENLYVARYWEISDELPDDRSAPIPLRAGIRYLSLCEDELELRSLGRVTHATWDIWGAAIESAMTDPRWQHLLSTQPGRFALLRAFVENRMDPFTGNRRRSAVVSGL